MYRLNFLPDCHNIASFKNVKWFCFVFEVHVMNLRFLFVFLLAILADAIVSPLNLVINLYSCLFIVLLFWWGANNRTYASKYIPIIASVSKHQPPTWPSKFADINVLAFYSVSDPHSWARYISPFTHTL